MTYPAGMVRAVARVPRADYAYLSIIAFANCYSVLLSNDPAGYAGGDSSRLSCGQSATLAGAARLFNGLAGRSDIDAAERLAADQRRYTWRHRECGPDCVVTGGPCPPPPAVPRLISAAEIAADAADKALTDHLNGRGPAPVSPMGVALSGIADDRATRAARASRRGESGAVRVVLAVILAAAFIAMAGAAIGRTTAPAVRGHVAPVIRTRTITRTVTRVRTVHVAAVDPIGAAIARHADAMRDYCETGQHRKARTWAEVDAAGAVDIYGACTGPRLQEDDPGWDAETMGNGDIGPAWDCQTMGDRVCQNGADR